MMDQAQSQSVTPVLISPAGNPIPVSLFSMVLGLSGLGYALLSGSKLWGIPQGVAETELLLTLVVWGGLILTYLVQFLRDPDLIAKEFHDPSQGSQAALIGISTLALVPGLVRYSFAGACVVAAAGISWHVGFSLWHTSKLWQGTRDINDVSPALYLPDVAGNFTSAAALGALGQADLAWLFLGAGVFSWLTLEPVIKNSIWHRPGLAPSRRPLMGIQAAPAVVCAASVLLVNPQITGPWVLMLLGYGLFQLMQGFRLISWLKVQRFARSYWAYTFGMTSALNVCLKLALAGNVAARALSLPLMTVVTAFIIYLFVRTVRGK
ncbi:dicarboxylate transporter/tellurite-resistance protein TehA [Duganella sp. LjRoot269]|uniref:SLAC1 family transporter n=1 Tax=Duganella sp. LjRoot269 TaxID=3342305 RepID=UPI003ED14F78